MNFQRLEKRIVRLQKRLPVILAGGVPTENQEDRIAAYLLISSAELEGYMKSRIRNLLDDILAEYTQNKRIVEHLLYIFHFSHPAKGCEKVKNFNKNFSLSQVDAIEKAFEKSQGRVASCYGIAPKKIKIILSYLVLDINTDFWDDVIRDFEPLSSARNDVAHKGVGVRKLHSPEDCIRFVSLSLKAMNKIDEKINDMRRLCKIKPYKTR